MGWLGLDEPQHIEGYLNGILHDHDAVAVENMNAEGFRDWVNKQIAYPYPDLIKPYGLWYVGRLHTGTENEREYIGLILIEFDFEHEYSVGSSSPFEKAWRYKVVSAMEGPLQYDCPLEYLDRVDCDTSSEFEARWREKVRAHHAAV